MVAGLAAVCVGRACCRVITLYSGGAGGTDNGSNMVSVDPSDWEHHRRQEETRPGQQR